MEIEQAIRICKRRINIFKLNCAITNEDIEAIKTLLQALEKLQEDNYKLDKENQKLFEINIDSIPKKKIEDLLEEVYTDEGIGYELDKDEKPGAVRALKELLEDK